MHTLKQNDTIKTVIFGAVMLFGAPILLGVVVGRLVDTLLGIITGVLIFVAIVAVALRYMKKESNQKDKQND